MAVTEKTRILTDFCPSSDQSTKPQVQLKIHLVQSTIPLYQSTTHHLNQSTKPLDQSTMHLDQSTKPHDQSITPLYYSRIPLYQSSKHFDQSKFQVQSKFQDCSKLQNHSKIILTVSHNLMNIKSTTDPGKGSKLKVDESADRLKTFTIPPPWEGPVDIHSMSEAGFVYTGQEDLVFCFSCNIKLDEWTKHMDPLLRHKEESPTCSFVRQQLQVIKGEKGKVKSVVAPSKPLNPRLTASIGQLQSLTLFDSKPIHTVVTGLDESRSFLSALPINAENYRSEAERIRSFVGWPLNESVHPEQLAKVGFVYTGEGSLVQCFQCGVRYRNWLKGDIPLSIHQRYNPWCAFLHMLTIKSKSVEEQRPSFSYIQPESMLPTTQSEDITLDFPDYTDQATRLQSFKYWGGVLPKEWLAEAGFCMIARQDVVRCFSCRVVLQDWERTDNVIDEHQRHSCNCPFLKTYLSNITASSHVSASIVKSKKYHSSQFNTIVTSSLDIRHSPSVGKSFHKPSLPGFIMNEGLPRSDDNEGEAIQGICYPPSWRSNPPSLSPPPGGSDSEESVSSQKKLGYIDLSPPSNDTTSKNKLIDLLPRSEASPNLPVETEKNEFSTDKLQIIRLTDSRGYIIPIGVSAVNIAVESYLIAKEYGRCVTNIIKPRLDHADMCTLSEGVEANSAAELSSSPSSCEESGKDDSTTAAPVNSGLCQICYDKKIECIFLPCGHARTCEECATRIKNSGKPCPYCRKPVSTTHRIYL
ncbi:baculoviral IAP repeat-containing protein 2-like isoform X2 [Dysidea avara]|uniref:baculoviral IAP repeat-containing protein 2-like isoform X2 n=1 Tax=Dysidea avara TaxID=196820 RepID=UPI00332DE98F